jgi:hypothetical protein
MNIDSQIPSIIAFIEKHSCSEVSIQYTISHFLHEKDQVTSIFILIVWKDGDQNLRCHSQELDLKLTVTGP